MNKITNISKEGTFLKIILWTSRIVGTLFVLFVAFFVIADVIDSFNNNSHSASNPWNALMIITAICFLIGLAGLTIALWYQGIGGLISFIGMLLWIALVRFNPKANYSDMYFIFFIPSLLYLCYWWLAKKSFIENSKS
jgi:hypothetical protein